MKEVNVGGVNGIVEHRGVVALELHGPVHRLPSAPQQHL